MHLAVPGEGAVPQLFPSVFLPMTALTRNIPNFDKTKGVVSKLRLARIIDGRDEIPAERTVDDPFVVTGCMSFNIDSVDNVEAVSEIGSRRVDYAPGTITSQGTMTIYFQRDYMNTILGELMSMNFRDTGERFYAECHYTDGRFLTAPILITNRADAISPQAVNQVNFNFVCTEVPDYKYLAIQLVPPSAPGTPIIEDEDRGTNKILGPDNLMRVTGTPAEAQSDDYPVEGYKARYRLTNSKGVTTAWRSYGGSVALTGTGDEQVYATNTVRDASDANITDRTDFGLPSSSTEVQFWATSDVPNNEYSDTLFIGAQPKFTVQRSGLTVNVVNYTYNGNHARGRRVEDVYRKIGTASAILTNDDVLDEDDIVDFNADTGLSDNITIAANNSVALRVLFDDDSISYWQVVASTGMSIKPGNPDIPANSPAVVATTAGSATLSVVFNETLQASAVPAVGAFSVNTMGAGEQTPDSVVITNNTAQVVVSYTGAEATAAASAGTWILSYTKPSGSNALTGVTQGSVKGTKVDSFSITASA